jgi:hypothetical protein
VDFEQGTQEFLQRKLDHHEERVRFYRDALALYKRLGTPGPVTDETRYVGKRPIEVFRPYLENAKGLRTATELIAELESGGNTRGKKSGTGMIAIKKSLNSGALVLFENGRAVPKGQVGAKIKPIEDPDKMVIGLPGRKYGKDGREIE